MTADSCDLTAFVRPGETRKKDLEQEWGAPSRTIDQERIWFYRLEGDLRKPRFSEETGPWKRSRYSLVLVFDDADLLDRVSIVRVR